VKGAINRIGFKGIDILELFEEDFYHEMIAVARIAKGFYEHLGECRFLAGKVLTNIAEKLPMNDRCQKNHLFFLLGAAPYTTWLIRYRWVKGWVGG
jgi:hypothetical protein